MHNDEAQRRRANEAEGPGAGLTPWAGAGTGRNAPGGPGPVAPLSSPCRAEGSTWGTGCETLFLGHPQAIPQAGGRVGLPGVSRAVTALSVCCDPGPPVPTSWSPFLTRDLAGRFTSRAGILAHNPLLSFGKVTWCPGHLPTQP